MREHSCGGHEMNQVALFDELDHGVVDLPDAEGQGAFIWSDPGILESLEIGVPDGRGDVRWIGDATVQKRWIALDVQNVDVGKMLRRFRLVGRDPDIIR